MATPIYFILVIAVAIVAIAVVLVVTCRGKSNFVLGDSKVSPITVVPLKNPSNTPWELLYDYDSQLHGLCYYADSDSKTALGGIPLSICGMLASAKVSEISTKTPLIVRVETHNPSGRYVLAQMTCDVSADDIFTCDKASVCGITENFQLSDDAACLNCKPATSNHCLCCADCEKGGWGNPTTYNEKCKKYWNHDTPCPPYQGCDSTCRALTNTGCYNSLGVQDTSQQVTGCVNPELTGTLDMGDFYIAFNTWFAMGFIDTDEWNVLNNNSVGSKLDKTVVALFPVTYSTKNIMDWINGLGGLQGGPAWYSTATNQVVLKPRGCENKCECCAYNKGRRYYELLEISKSGNDITMKRYSNADQGSSPVLTNTNDRFDPTHIYQAQVRDNESYFTIETGHQYGNTSAISNLEWARATALFSLSRSTSDEQGKVKNYAQLVATLTERDGFGNALRYNCTGNGCTSNNFSGCSGYCHHRVMIDPFAPQNYNLVKKFINSDPYMFYAMCTGYMDSTKISAKLYSFLKTRVYEETTGDKVPISICTEKLKNNPNYIKLCQPGSSLFNSPGNNFCGCYKGFQGISKTEQEIAKAFQDNPQLKGKDWPVCVYAECDSPTAFKTQGVFNTVCPSICQQVVTDISKEDSRIYNNSQLCQVCNDPSKGGSAQQNPCAYLCAEAGSKCPDGYYCGSGVCRKSDCDAGQCMSGNTCVDECPSGQTCQNGVCVSSGPPPPCSPPCVSPEQCINGKCVAPSPPPGHKTNVGMIVGIVVAGLAIIGLLVGGIFFIRHLHKIRSRQIS